MARYEMPITRSEFIDFLMANPCDAAGTPDLCPLQYCVSELRRGHLPADEVYSTRWTREVAQAVSLICPDGRWHALTRDMVLTAIEGA